MSVLKIKSTPSGTWKGIPTIKGAKGDKGDTGGNVTDAVKLALLQIAQDVWYLDDKGPTYIQNLQDALFPPSDIASISAVYTQSGAVYNTDDIDDLKTDLVVTASKTGGTTQTIAAADYTLFGELNVGTSTISVIYRGYTTTFDVVVTREPNNLVDGTYKSGGYGGVTVISNHISYGSSQTSSYKYSIPFAKPIQLKAGDVVLFSTSDRSPVANALIGVGFNGAQVRNLHPLTSEYAPESYTMPSDVTANSLFISSNGAMADASFTFILKVNGEVVI